MCPDDGRHERRSPRRLTDRKAKPYRVIAVSLYLSDMEIADQLTDVLRYGGWPKANRSLVLREGLTLLHEELAGTTPEEIFRFFVERHARRAAITARRRELGRTSDENPSRSTKSGPKD